MQQQNTSNRVYIYTLNDPGTDEVRYVGQTKRTTEERFIGHINDAAKGKQTRVARWIAKLARCGQKPVIRIIDIVAESERGSAEKKWIAYYRERIGARLTNLTDGGEGRSGYPCTDETKRRISIANKGNKGPSGLVRPEDTRRKMSVAQLERNLADARVLISDEKVHELRDAYATTEATLYELAQRYKISESVVYRIVRGLCRIEAGGHICTKGVRKQQVKCRGKVYRSRRVDTAPMFSPAKSQSADG